MADIFTKTDTQYLLFEKVIWFLGDSNIRAQYKDLVWLLQKNTLIQLTALKRKLEQHFMNDDLVKKSTLSRGRDFEEVRVYKNYELKLTVKFMFLTKCLTKELNDALGNIKSKKEPSPDIIIMNSCLWDIVRWGPDGVKEYKKNIPKMLKLVKSSVSPSTLFIWTTTPPISSKPYGGMLIQQVEFMRQMLRFEVMEGNMFVRQEVVTHGFDVLDIHFHLLLQIHRRNGDGIHWSPEAVRHITNLLLTHIALSLDSPLPGNFKGPEVDRMIHLEPAPVINGRELETLEKLNQIVNGLDKSQPTTTSRPCGLMTRRVTNEQQSDCAPMRTRVKGRRNRRNAGFPYSSEDHGGRQVASFASDNCWMNDTRTAPYEQLNYNTYNTPALPGWNQRVTPWHTQHNYSNNYNSWDVSRFRNSMVQNQYLVSSLAKTKQVLKLDEIVLERLLFNEKLYVFNTEGRRCGRFSVNISLNRESTPLLLVHISNKATLNQVLTETTVTGYVDRTLKTSEEYRHETCDLPSGKQDRRLCLLREVTKYHYSVTTSVCDVTAVKNATIPFSKTSGLIGEASNAILLRALAIQGYQGILSLSTILSNGHRCHNYYVTRLTEQPVNGVKMEVMVVYRNVTNHKKQNVTMTMTLTRLGRLVHLFWSNSDTFLHVDPELQVYGVERGIGLERHWNRDEQLYSMYLDRVVHKQAETRSYIYDAVQLRAIVADFIHYCLHVRPTDIVCFAIRYFTAFGSASESECLTKVPKKRAHTAPKLDDGYGPECEESPCYWDAQE